MPKQPSSLSHWRSVQVGDLWPNLEAKEISHPLCRRSAPCSERKRTSVVRGFIQASVNMQRFSSGIDWKCARPAYSTVQLQWKMRTEWKIGCRCSAADTSRGLLPNTRRKKFARSLLSCGQPVIEKVYGLW